MALERAVGRALPSGLFSGFLDKVRAGGMSVCFGARAKVPSLGTSMLCDKVSTGLWKVSAASPTPHPPVNPLFLTLFLTFQPIGTQKLV